MSQTRPDDVGSLLSQIDLDHASYKVFRGESRKNSKAPQPEEIANEKEPQDLPEFAARIETAGPSPLREFKRNSARLETDCYVDRNRSWIGLDVALSESDLGGRPGQALSNSRQIPVPGISLCSLSGGVGVTSLVAALARISARWGERPLLLDAGTPGLLPFYFGARAARPHVSTFIDPETRGPIHIASRQVESASGAADAWIWRSFVSVAQETDIVFADIPVRSMGEDLSVFLEQTTAILVLIPDVRCLMSLRQLDKLTSGAEAVGAPNALPYLLLNDFDSSNPLHLEVHHRMATQFKDRLIPLTVRRDRRVSDALAHGMTVIDYVPGSPVTEDLHRLAEWLQAKRAKRRATAASSR